MDYNLKNKYDDLNEKINKITTEQKIEYFETVSDALKKPKLEINNWRQINDVIVVFSDLKNSTGISFDKQDKTMTKLLEYLNNPFIEIHDSYGAEFIEIKGDGGIAIYSKEKAIEALLASISIKTFYYKHINKKVKNTYNVDFEVTTGISKGNLKLKLIGKRGLNFPVWAGETINLSALISKELKRKSSPSNYIGITNDIYKEIENKKLDEYLYFCCNCGEKSNLWKCETIPNKGGKKYYYMNNTWCDIHGQEYHNKILKINHEC